MSKINRGTSYPGRTHNFKRSPSRSSCVIQDLEPTAPSPYIIDWSHKISCSNVRGNSAVNKTEMHAQLVVHSHEMAEGGCTGVGV